MWSETLCVGEQAIEELLWDLRGELLKYRLEVQDYFMDLKDAELAYTPTLWDFAVLRWTEYLLRESDVTGAPPAADRFAEPAFRADYSASAPAALKAAAIYEEAAGISSASGDGGSLHTARDFAREHWRLYPRFADQAAFFDLEADGDQQITVAGVMVRSPGT